MHEIERILCDQSKQRSDIWAPVEPATLAAAAAAEQVLSSKQGETSLRVCCLVSQLCMTLWTPWTVAL